MPAINLTPSERKDQRALAHHLDPVVFIGGDGLTPAVTKEIDLALNAHGLIKVRVFSDDRMARAAMFTQLSDVLRAAPIQHIGKLLVFWRPMPPKEKVEREDRGGGNHRPQVKKIKVLGNQRIAAGGELKRARKRAAVSPKKSARD